VGWHAEAGHPLADEGVPAGLRLDVGQGHCLQHPAGPVDYGEQGREKAGEVDPAEPHVRLLGFEEVHQALRLAEPHDWPGLLVGGQLEGSGGSPGRLLLAAATVLLARLGGISNKF